MAKTSMITVINRIMGITRRLIEADGRCTLERCRVDYSTDHGLPVGEEFVLNIWYQHSKELEVVYVGGAGWVARNLKPVETDDDMDAPDA